MEKFKLPEEPNSLHPNASPLELLASLSASERESLLSKLSEGEKDTMWWDWQGFQARINQRMPKGDWTYWILLAGRGFGKTRTGAETVRTMVTEQGYRRIHLVASTAADVRDVMIQGESGLLSCFPAHQRPLYEPSKRLVTFHNGAIAVAFSADEPERLRGPQCDGFWADELAAWRFVQEAWDNLQFGFRLGARPRGIVSTTPKPIKLLKEILAAPDTVITRASSYENRLNLAPAFFKSIVRKYEGTRIGRQELLAELLEDVPGALWTRALIDATRLTLREVRWDLIVRIVVAVDPAVTHKEDSDESGIVVAGVTRSRHVIILDDLSCKGTVYEWARVTIAAYKSRQADRVVGEVNNGGDLVEANIRTADPNVAFQAVHASRGKRIRAEPVAALYEQGRVHHVGSFGILEDQMCGWTPQSTDGSPDRMDALVWAVTALVIDTPEETFRVEYGSDEEISQI